MTTTVHVREGFFIRKDSLSSDIRRKLDEKYTHMFYEEKACAKCEYRPERHLEDICGNCAAFKGGAKLSKVTLIKDKKYIQTPIGDRAGLEKILEKAGVDFKYKTHFPDLDMSRPIKFTGTLRDYQPGAVTAMVKKKRGVLKAPPRSGKTVMATAAVCRIGKKTIIMASQRDWLDGFMETFIGSKTQEALTNIKRSKIGFAKTYEDFCKYDVCLVTVQTFYSEKGKKLLRKIRDMFAVVVVDEIHTGAAPEYATVLANLNCKWKLGLSGTPNRKDGRFVLMRDLIGPNLFEAKVERLRPHVKLVRTGYTRNIKGNVPWAHIVGPLERDPKRLKLIAQWAVKDVKDGHMVMIPFARIPVIKAMVMAINRLAGKNIAFPFHGGVKKTDRKLYIERARKYKIKVLVGNAKLLSTGINIPRASMLYDVTLSNNMENCDQRVSRILTPWDDKPPPTLRIFLDNMKVRQRCLSSEWWGCIRPRFKPIIRDVDETALKAYFSAKAAPMEGRIEL